MVISKYHIKAEAFNRHAISLLYLLYRILNLD